MPRIKVVGYIDPDTLDPGEFDPSVVGGLSEEGFDRVTNDLNSMGVTDPDFTLLEDGEE